MKPWPPYEELIERLKNSNFSKLAKEIGCSDNGLRAYLRRIKI